MYILGRNLVCKKSFRYRNFSFLCVCILKAAWYIFRIKYFQQNSSFKATGAPVSILLHFDVFEFSSYSDGYFLQSLIISQIDKVADDWKSEILWNLCKMTLFLKKWKTLNVISGKNLSSLGFCLDYQKIYEKVKIHRLEESLSKIWMKVDLWSPGDLF